MDKCWRIQIGDVILAEVYDQDLIDVIKAGDVIDRIVAKKANRAQSLATKTIAKARSARINTDHYKGDEDGE